MSASKTNEAMQLLFTFVFSFLLCILVSWILRGHQTFKILTDGIAGALAATTVVMWNNHARKKPKKLG